MRRWELVDGGSAKFWEIGRDDVDVTVRFGRLGTDGQTKVKSLADVAAAESHVAKLVAEKEKKGYRLVGDAVETAPVAPVVPTAPAEPGRDEDAFVMPPAWRRHALPRRDRGEPVFRPDEARIASGARLLAHGRPRAEKILADHRSEKKLAAAGREYLAGRPTPLGAAVVRLASMQDNYHRPDVAAVPHHWIAEHGPVFAAEAIMRCAEVHTTIDDEAEVNWGKGERPDCWVVPQTDDLPINHHQVLPGADAVRAALAAASDEEYAAAEEALEPLGADFTPNVLRAYLMPTRADWVAESLDEDIDHVHWALTACSISRPADLDVLDRSHGFMWDQEVVYTLVGAVGTAIAPLLAQELDSAYNHAESRKRALTILAGLPTDEAFTILLDRLEQNKVQPALLEAMKAFPNRAARLLAARALGDERMRGLFDAHLRAHPELTLSDEVRAVADQLTSGAGLLPVAPDEALPELLVRPPWTRRIKPVKPVVVEGLSAPEPSVTWAAGEQDAWLRETGYWANWGNENWEESRDQILNDKTNGHDETYFFAKGPEDIVRPMLAGWTPTYSYYGDEWGKVVAARYELDALAPLARYAGTSPQSLGVLLVPFASAEVAALMADWFCRTKSARKHAVEWLVRHGATAVRVLLPAALGEKGPERKNAEAALRFLGAQEHDLVAIAAEFGAAAREGAHALVSVDQTEVLPAKLPVVPAWADPHLLPQIKVRDEKQALPPSAVTHLLTTAALSKPGEVYAGLPIAAQACDPASLASFAWTVFERWVQAGGPSKDGWVLAALGWFGDDETVRRLSPLIRQWPGESQHQRAVTALDVLAEIGSEVALAHLNGIAEKVKFKGLKTKAQEKVAAIAAQLGLSREQLADRLVPRLGLDEAASLTIDYGARTFTVGFDEQLKPYVVDSDGKRRKDLPKPGARDDEELAPAEHQRFAALKKDVRTVAADQIHRLEAAMVTQRAWTAAEFRDLLAGHPLLWHIVRRLVWVTDGGASFRLAEDRTLADVEDGELTLPDDAQVRLAHPATLGADVLAAWGEVFADYEILQPFPQLGRPVYATEPGQALDVALKQFFGLETQVGKLLGLTKRGWVRGEPQDAGIECWITRPLPNGGAVVASLDPGIAVGLVDEFPDQQLTELWYSPSGHGSWSSPKDAAHTTELDPVTVSELLSELASLTS
ncbi:DUF4132 domain-containing protein [Lentzea tibetensis]|uniref:DUF4132 domain-containing protein n=1 Tax=Lentzea tibetensis TaxID=2591470 RepID=A0A563F194_9PSEU|nr:DUF4132 domain-containing protein [Lentzea tibetensis]TWP53756.1 DUF4132 domain-containing protein [Lentzea tibetensis]